MSQSKLSIASSVYRTRGLAAVIDLIRARIFFSPTRSDKILVRDPLFNVSEDALLRNASLLRDRLPGQIHSATWFIPYADTQAMGGRATIYRFARFMAQNKGVVSRFALLTNTNATTADGFRMLAPHIPNLSETSVSIIRDPFDIQQLPPTDVGVATKWNTAYALLHFNQCKDKFYFVQDFEPAFYPAGISYAAAEATYRFGFGGIVSTPGLEEEYAAYANRHVSFVPAVDRNIYYPREVSRKETPIRIVFYGRPSVARNGFILGIEALKDVKQRYGDSVEIVTAGEQWSPEQYGVDGLIENKGLLRSLDDVAALYRDAHIGLGLIFTKHTSYQPFEYMACGAAVVMNRNRFARWFLRDLNNCLLAEPTVADISAKIGTLIENPSLRRHLVQEGLKSVAHLNWANQFEIVWKFMTEQ